MTTTGLDLYNATAEASAAVVIRRYSTSFGWASRLLDASTRDHIARVYALVRIADELVDGPAEMAGVDNRNENRAAERRSRLRNSQPDPWTRPRFS